MKSFFIIFLFIYSLALFAQERIVSLAPNLTEIIYMLGGEKLLVGRSSYCHYPEAANKLPVAGGFDNPNIEKIILLKPTMLLVTDLKDFSAKSILENAGIKVYILKCDSINDYIKSLEFLGKKLKVEKNAEIEIKRVKEKIQSLNLEISKIPIKKRPTVFIEISSNPLITAGNKSFLNEYINLAGGINIGERENRTYFQVSKEFVIEKNPDVIIAPDLNEKAIKELKSSSMLGWNNISAVKNNRVYNKIDTNLLYILGPRMFDTIAAIHNELYQ